MGDEMHTTGACGPAGGPRTAHQAIAAFTNVGRKYEILGKSREQIIERYGM